MKMPCKKLQNSLVAFLAFVLTLASPQIVHAAANADNGQKLFKANCTSCHAIGKKVVGPDLNGVTKRVPQPYEDWMLKWIKNNAAVIKSGDKYATDLLAANNNSAMTVFDGVLTDDQIKDIIAYLVVAKPEAAVVTTPGGPTPGAPAGEKHENHVGIILIIIVALLIMITVLRTVRKSLQNVVNEKKGEAAVAEGSVWKDAKRWMYHNKTKTAVIVLVLVSFSTVKGWEYLWNIDVTPGYHPSQPINFMHSVHAGDNGIACIYCHSGAEKGKVAGIPTLNVCMNCHKGVQGSNPAYQKEIAKIYYAVGWNTDKMDYTNPPHPVVWNRVHSLPDFAYFNHAQHVVVGKLQCEKCHGDVKTFTTDQQFAPLTMGWCINCHRETPVQMEGNGYYAKLHEAIKKNFGDDKVVTEAEMGGLECGKCHY